MSSLHEVDEQFLPVEEDMGQWLVLVGPHAYHVHVGPFASALEAHDWATDHVNEPWDVALMVRPEDWPGGGDPPAPEPADEQGELGYGEEPTGDATP